VEPCRLTGEPIAFDIHHEARLFASFALGLFNLTRLWAGFAEGFNQSLNVNTFPKRLLTNCVLFTMMLSTQRNNAPVIRLLPHACTAAYPDMCDFDRHLLTSIDRTMKRSNEVHVPL
jgi:hypothetical protein